MNLSEERKKELNDMYGNLSEELRIFYRSLKNEGFDAKEAMDIMLVIISRPNTIEAYSHQYNETKRREALKKLRNSRVRIQEKEEPNENTNG